MDLRFSQQVPQQEVSVQGQVHRAGLPSRPLSMPTGVTGLKLSTRGTVPDQCRRRFIFPGSVWLGCA